MKTINLKDYYDHITTDTLIEVPEQIFELFEEQRKAEQAYQSKLYYHHANYSLDCDDGIEHKALFLSLSPEELYSRSLTAKQLHKAISMLPDKQAKRLYAHYFLGMKKTEIAQVERVSEASVRESIERGLRNLEKYLKSL